MFNIKEFVRFHTEEKTGTKPKANKEEMSLKRRFMSKSDNEEKDDIIATPSHSPPPLVARYVTTKAAFKEYKFANS